MLAFLLLAAEAEASTMSARIAHLLTPTNTRSITIALRKATQTGEYKKIHKVVRLISDHSPNIDHRDLNRALLDVANSGNPKAIDLLVELADERGHPYDYHNTFGFMIRNTAESGNLEAIDLVVKLADEHRLKINADDFCYAMECAADNGNSKTISHVFTIATRRKVKLKGDLFARRVQWPAANSGDPKTIALVNKIAIEQGIKIKDNWGRAIERAVETKNYEAVRQIIEIADELGVKLEGRFFDGAMLRAAETKNYEAVRQITEIADEFGIKLEDKYYYVKILAQVAKEILFLAEPTKQLGVIVDFAAERGVKFNADDFGLAIAQVASSGNTNGVRKVFELAAEHGVTLSHQHFVAAMKAAGLHYKTLNRTVKIADEYGIKLNADDFATTMLQAMDSLRYAFSHPLRYNAILRINDLAIKYDVKLEKKHLSYLLAKALLIADNSDKKAIEAVIALTTSLGIEADAEYFNTAFAYVRQENSHRTMEQLKKVSEVFNYQGVRLNAADAKYYSTAFANVRPEDHRLTAEQLKIINEVIIDYGIRLNAEDVQFSLEEDL